MAHDVFISHSAKDKAVADAACARLERAGYRCWIAPRDVSGEWAKAIVDAIRGARVFVLIFSREANLSPQVNREVERAVSNGLSVVPLRIEDVAPSDALEYFISNQHWLDALAPPLERHLDRLADMVGKLLSGPPAVLRQPSPRAAAAPLKQGPNWPLWIASLLILTSLAGGTGFWLSRDSSAEPPEVTDQNANLPGSAPRLADPAPELPPEPLISLLDFNSVPTASSTSREVDAAEYLDDAAIPVRVVSVTPANMKLVFIGGRAIDNHTATPHPDRNFLYVSQWWYWSQRPREATPPPNVATSFTLELDEPVGQFRFSVPAMGSGLFPAITVIAYNPAGEEVRRISRELFAQYAPAQTFTLSALGPEGIKRVRFHADPQSAPLGISPMMLVDGISVRRLRPREAPR